MRGSLVVYGEYNNGDTAKGFKGFRGVTMIALEKICQWLVCTALFVLIAGICTFLI